MSGSREILVFHNSDACVSTGAAAIVCHAGGQSGHRRDLARRVALRLQHQDRDGGELLRDRGDGQLRLSLFGFLCWRSE
jgi:hypothetical protein